MHGGPPLQNAPPPAQNTQQQSSNRQSASLVNGKIVFIEFQFVYKFETFSETKLHLEVHTRRSHESGVGRQIQPQW